MKEVIHDSEANPEPFDVPPAEGIAPSRFA
jgi:hypothetical protein